MRSVRFKVRGFMDDGATSLHDEEVEADGQLFSDLSDSSSFLTGEYGDEDDGMADGHRHDMLDWPFTIGEGSSPTIGGDRPQSSSVRLPARLPQGAGMQSPVAAAGGHQEDSSQSGQANGAAPGRTQKRARGGRRVNTEEDEESARSRPRVRAGATSASAVDP
eukprot:COSAG02_NODE_31319_length_535_cov_1.896789_1_plen_162_part_10